MSDGREPLSELHRFEGDALPPALCEAIRLLESDEFEHLTEADVRAVADYRAIELNEEPFFERAFTPGKEAAASLGFARLLGRELVLDDLRRLRAALGCKCHREETAAAPST
jgi:hypothetical protein